MPQDRYPTKRVCGLTVEGEGVLRRWLEESPVGPDRQRNLFLVRVFFADRMSPARLEAIIGEYETDARARRDVLADVVRRLADRPQAAFRRATAMFGARCEEAKLDWVAEVRPLLLAAASASGQGGEAG